MQNTMLDSTTSCIQSTLNFVCDVDGVHTEIPIPSSAWDFGNILEDEELPADSVIKESFRTAADRNYKRTQLLRNP